jgi:hypothetical protein
LSDSFFEILATANKGNFGKEPHHSTIPPTGHGQIAYTAEDQYNFKKKGSNITYLNITVTKILQILHYIFKRQNNIIRLSSILYFVRGVCFAYSFLL